MQKVFEKFFMYLKIFFEKNIFYMKFLDGECLVALSSQNVLAKFVNNCENIA